jgi:tRNA-modifying protein YgfZ
MNMPLHLHDATSAVLASDGIPLHFGDQAAEYRAALHDAVLMDRSHEGRLLLTGKDRLELIGRMSTNDTTRLNHGEGVPTIFTSPIGRIIDRVTVYHLGDETLVLTEPGRGEAVRGYIARNTFFNDEVHQTDLGPSHAAFALHGPRADEIVRVFSVEAADTTGLSSRRVTIAGADCIISRMKPVSGAAWSVLAPRDAAAAVWHALLEAGRSAGIRPAGSLTYNVLRIRAGRPGVMRELSADYIPLEVGLWDEISFTKGCYTGQEIIARMESRRRLARTIVMLAPDADVTAPAPVFSDGRQVGSITSAATAPDGERFAIGVVKVAAAQPGMLVQIGSPDGPASARVMRFAGVQPELQPEAE